MQSARVSSVLFSFRQQLFWLFLIVLYFLFSVFVFFFIGVGYLDLYGTNAPNQNQLLEWNTLVYLTVGFLWTAMFLYPLLIAQKRKNRKIVRQYTGIWLVSQILTLFGFIFFMRSQGSLDLLLIAVYILPFLSLLFFRLTRGKFRVIDDGAA